VRKRAVPVIPVSERPYPDRQSPFALTRCPRAPSCRHAQTRSGRRPRYGHGTVREADDVPDSRESLVLSSEALIFQKILELLLDAYKSRVDGPSVLL
jgi:hypothetical protein